MIVFEQVLPICNCTRSLILVLQLLNKIFIICVMHCRSEITSFNTSRYIDARACRICYSDIRRYLFLSFVFFFVVVMPFVIMTVIMVVVVPMRMIMSATRMIMIGMVVDLESLWILCCFGLGLCFACFSLGLALPFLVLYCLPNNISNGTKTVRHNTNLMPSP